MEAWLIGSPWARIGILGLATLMPVLLAATLRAERSAPAMRLEVSIAARRLSVIENGRVVKTYAVAVGRASNPTPRGSFRTGQIVWNPWWKPPLTWWARKKKPQPPGDPDNPMQGVKIYFRAPDYYIHGTNDPASIGRAASRGCIRMTPGDAKNLARRIRKAGGSVPLRIAAIESATTFG
jgi:lipoprotein-anchoring transpeptidase ErfK/SrfK